AQLDKNVGFDLQKIPGRIVEAKAGLEAQHDLLEHLVLEFRRHVHKFVIGAANHMEIMLLAAEAVEGENRLFVFADLDGDRLRVRTWRGQQQGGQRQNENRLM